jgi:hypothetical protein
MLSACGSSSSRAPGSNASLTGNWQFTLAPPADGSFLGGLQGGFLLQSGGSVSGAAAYAVSLPQFLIPCNTGSAAVTGAVNGQNISLTAAAGTQTFSFTGTLSLDGATMVGTYATTAGTAVNGAPCGTLQSGLQWSASLVAPITGDIQGNFHSTSVRSGLNNQDFALSGNLVQGQNTGGSTATLTGTLSFLDPATNLSAYPCFVTAAVSGQISGTSVILQIVTTNGSIIGQIGQPADSPTGINPVTYNSVQGGYILQGAGPSYMVATSACPGSLGSTSVAGDYGNVCLALATAETPNACLQPISLAPASLAFPAQTTGTSSTQTIALANNSSTALSGLVVALANIPSSASNFSETDACGPAGIPSLGEPFDLAAGQSCAIMITFTPQQCAAQCQSALNATLTVTSPVSTDNDKVFAVPISGTGVTGSAASISGFHFGASTRPSPIAALDRGSGHPAQIAGFE